MNVGDLAGGQVVGKTALDRIGAALVGGTEGVLGIVVPDDVVEHFLVGAKDEPANDFDLAGLPPGGCIRRWNRWSGHR